MTGVIIYGDPHGEWQPLLQACEQEPPDGVILIGDCDLTMPLRQQIAPLFSARIPVWWIPGNHDADTPQRYDWLWGDHPDGNLHARAETIGGLTCAGLGGIFRGKVWYPRETLSDPEFASKADYVRSLKHQERWRGGLPLRMRDTLYPDDVAALARVRADVLVTHEAPSSHQHGFVGIDAAAAACHARLVVHGHHHRSTEGILPDGTPVRGLAKAEVLRLGCPLVQDKHKVRLTQLIEAVNDLFEGKITDGDAVAYVDWVLKTKLLESVVLRAQAAANTKEQFTNSPSLGDEMVKAIIAARDANKEMSTQALNSESIQARLIEFLLGPGNLYEGLRDDKQTP
jgi:3',5'-cyclic AMP phosphodiesterase CpdA